MADPSSAEFIIHSWMTYLRDGYLLSQGQSAELYNQDIQSFAQKFAEQKNIPTLFDEIFQFRQDWLANVDKNLLLDHLSMRLEPMTSQSAGGA